MRQMMLNFSHWYWPQMFICAWAIFMYGRSFAFCAKHIKFVRTRVEADLPEHVMIPDSLKHGIERFSLVVTPLFYPLPVIGCLLYSGFFA